MLFYINACFSPISLMWWLLFCYLYSQKWVLSWLLKSHLAYSFCIVFITGTYGPHMDLKCPVTHGLSCSLLIGKKPRTKAPKIQRLVTPRVLQHKRRRIALKKQRTLKNKEEAAEYTKLLAKRMKVCNCGLNFLQSLIGVFLQCNLCAWMKPRICRKKKCMDWIFNWIAAIALSTNG